MCLPFFTSTTITHVLLILHGLLLFFFFSWNWISVCLNNLQILQRIQKNYWSGWQDHAAHWTCNVMQGWEWRIAWLFLYCCLQFIFLRFIRNHLKNQILEQNSFLYLIRKLLNSLLQLMLIYTSVNRHSLLKVKGKAVPLQAWSGAEGSRKLWFQDFMTTAPDGGKVSLTHRPPLPPGNAHGTHFC